MTKSVDFNEISDFATTPEESVGFLMWRVSTQWRSALEVVLKPLDLTHPQFVVLATLGWLTQKGERVSQVKVGKTAALDPNTTSQILRGLEAKKFIERIRSSDERSKNPFLTDLGAERLKVALPAIEAADKKFFRLLENKELSELIKTFQRLI